MDPRGLSAAELQAVAALWARTGRTIEARFTGSSMAPAIPDGCLVRLQCGLAPRPGDVVAFVWDGHVLLHRLQARTGVLALTRGDALVVPDPPIPADLPFARAVAVREGDAWIEPAHPEPSAIQSVVLALCRTAVRIDVRLGRAVIALLRRLRPPESSRLDVHE